MKQSLETDFNYFFLFTNMQTNNKLYTNIAKIYTKFCIDINYKDTHVCVLYMCMST